LELSLNMPENGYNTCIWIFFLPFVLVEIPSNLIMSLPRVKPNVFLGTNMLILGIIATCQGLTHSYGGLLALRFLMGIFEATLPAGAALLIGEYYTRKQQSLRFACFYTFAVFGPAISGLLAFGIRNMDGIQGKEGWRYGCTYLSSRTYTDVADGSSFSRGSAPWRFLSWSFYSYQIFRSGRRS
jgi:MFS family permease